MNPQQIATTIVGALLIAAILGIVRWVQGKANTTDVEKWNAEHRAMDEKVHAGDKETIAKLETKLDAGLLVIAQAITRPELAEKLLAITGRSDDARQRIIADIVQLGIDAKANTKANAETDKRLDDIPNRVASLEQTRNQNQK